MRHRRASLTLIPARSATCDEPVLRIVNPVTVTSSASTRRTVRAPSPSRIAPGWPTKIGRAPSELQSLAYLVCRLLLEKKKHNIMEIGRGFGRSGVLCSEVMELWAGSHYDAESLWRTGGHDDLGGCLTSVRR